LLKNPPTGGVFQLLSVSTRLAIEPESQFLEKVSGLYLKDSRFAEKQLGDL
jgi:hypothetical protein